MLTCEEAKKIVCARLDIHMPPVPNDWLIVIDSETIEKPYAWIFTYTSKLWYETKDDKFAIAGNAPIIVNKQTGEMTSFSTAYNMDSIIEKYEEERKLWSLVLTDTNLPDNKVILQLKHKLGLSNDKIFQLKKDNTISIDSGSHSRLTSLQAELLAMGIDTKLTLAWDVT